MDDSIDIRLVIEADIATTQLIQQILKACEARNIRTSVCRLDDLKVSDFGPRTIPLFVRCGDPYIRAWTDALATANRIYVYYIDDNFWRIVGTTSLAAYYRHPIVRRALESSIAHAQSVTTSSAELAQFVGRFNPHVVVLPTFFDFALLDNVATATAPPSEIRIGFAGSWSRLDDLDVVAPVIPQILEQFPQAVFEFVGAFPRGIIESDRVRRFAHTAGYSDYVRWQQERGWAIGLAPLVDHEANRSKTDNKYREYGAFGYAGIYSAIPPYAHIVRHGETGLLVANTPEAWRDAIVTLLTKPEQRTSIARNAFTDVRQRYDITRVSEQWAQHLQHVAAQLRPDIAPIDEGLLKRRIRKAFVERWRVHIALRYHEGGIGLVARRALIMIGRRLKRAFGRS